MEFEPSYFREEVRIGYYVPGVMKRYWAAQMEILSDVAAVCEEYGIKWFADYGTLLGAVRHGGFIPWDDDLDICMLRKDYDRFIKIAGDALPSNYKVINFYTADFSDSLTRIVSTDYICLDDEFVSKFHDIPYSVGIDVYVLDYISDDEEAENGRKELYDLVTKVAVSCELGKELTSEETELLDMIEQCCGVVINRDGTEKRQLRILGDNLARLFDVSECSKVANMNYWVQYNNHIYPKDYYDGLLRIPFETGYIYVPRYYTGKLKSDYGSFGAFSHAGGLHGYPLYENNENALYEKFGAKDFFKYKLVSDCLVSDKEECSEVGNVLVLIAYSDTWKYAESVCLEELDKGNNVYVVMMPYYYRKIDGSFREMNVDEIPLEQIDEKLVNGLHIISYDEVFEREYNIIYTLNGYDAYNQTVSVRPDFYTSNLRKHTKRLVYIQPFITEALECPDPKTRKMMDYYVNIPALCYCNEIIIYSEENKKAYADYLCEKYEDISRSVWENKIVVCRKHVEANKNAHKKLLYYIGVDELLYHTDMCLNKLENNMQIFESNKELEVDLYIDVNGLSTLKDENMQGYNRLQNAISSISLCDDSNYCIDNYVAYYGDVGSYLKDFIVNKKPVMIADILIGY